MDVDNLTYFWKRFSSTYNPRWRIFELCKGDIRKSIDRSSSEYTKRFLHTVKRHDGVHTVIWVRVEDLERWRKISDETGLRHVIGFILGDKVGRRLFPAIYRVADEVKLQRKIASRISKGEKKNRKNG